MTTLCPRPGLDLHRRTYAPVPEPHPKTSFLSAAPPAPFSTMRAPSLSDISEESSQPSSSSESHFISLDGVTEGVTETLHPSNAIQEEEQQQQQPRGWRDRLTPGFRNAPGFGVWLRRCWIDVLTQLGCVLVAGAIYFFAAPLMPRRFPLYPGVGSGEWGMKYGKPLLREYVNTPVSAGVSFAVPAVVMGAVGLWGVRDFWEGNAAIMGLGYALATATLFQSFIKWFIGGLRPHFLVVCAPRIPSVPLAPDAICTGDPSAVKEAQMSFPSGHSAAAFAGFGFLAIYLNAKLKVIDSSPDILIVGTQRQEQQNTAALGRSNRSTAHWKMVVWTLPWLVALLIAASKIRDAWHHPVDVVFGGLIG
ncbi:hypothetical protein E8E13_002048 [Curvularia kusanoi]|uniref:Phosphatidic acid phosphatase type 2/haloperoxidase domain-containing protein n=1 Tax=Curvularia kusanoi TaxID=90978 RepID=A0A9P4T975_CURKU|nr:hypothetical protein E8E13_002048 [Curvularia kusanoi]